MSDQHDDDAPEQGEPDGTPEPGTETHVTTPSGTEVSETVGGPEAGDQGDGGNTPSASSGSTQQQPAERTDTGGQ